ncbi:hypothetical protein BURMUCF2_A0887 [Burkholderia multivorans CF2]|nr:hypothetical protein BURMUCF2_A0887 [Burkholderia multivorans CF2]
MHRGRHFWQDRRKPSIVVALSASAMRASRAWPRRPMPCRIRRRAAGLATVR